jgi:hypothetical protein
MFVIFWLIAYVRYSCYRWFASHPYRWRRKSNMVEQAPSVTLHFHRKPTWVIKKLILLAATHPGWGCRKVAALFNQRFAALAMNVSKSYVAGVLKTHQLAIQRHRQQ